MKWPWSKDEFKPVYVSLPGEESALDPASGTWAVVSAWAEKRIAELREQNDKPLDAYQTAAVRGQIKMAKQLLDLPKPGPGSSRPKAFAAGIIGAERSQDG